MSIRATLRTLFTLGKGITLGLPDAAAERDPIDLFAEWFDGARRSGIFLPESMALATAEADGAPSLRMVLLRGFDARGFVFYTNYRSRKARQIETNPRGALVLHWAVLQRQVTIEGPLSRVSAEESDAYFRNRPRGSQIGAWASRQSEPLDSRVRLEESFRTYEEQFAEQDVPRPPFWGGYRLAPERIQFWQGRSNRLHDRLCFTREGEGWTVTRLYP